MAKIEDTVEATVECTYSRELYTTHQRNMGMGKLLRRQQEMFREMGKLQRQTEDNEDEVAEPTETRGRRMAKLDISYPYRILTDEQRKIYDAAYARAIEDAVKVVNDYEVPTWCAVCDSRPHECGCEPDARARFMQHIIQDIRALAPKGGEKK